MSALGHEQTSRNVRVMSVIPLKADKRGLHVRLVPIAGIGGGGGHWKMLRGIGLTSWSMLRVAMPPPLQTPRTTLLQVSIAPGASRNSPP
jgi:hypothetical protein